MSERYSTDFNPGTSDEDKALITRYRKHNALKKLAASMPAAKPVETDEPEEDSLDTSVEEQEPAEPTPIAAAPTAAPSPKVVAAPTAIKAAGIDPDAPADASPSDKEYQTVYNRIKAMRESVTDPIDLQSFDKAEQEAKQLYQDRASRAEWLGVAERVGQSLLRLGAANEGLKKGVDMSHVDLGPGTDWDKKIDRAAGDYSTELSNQERRRSAALRNQQEQYGLAEKAYDVSAREKGIAAADKRAELNRISSETKQATAIDAANTRTDKRETERRDFETAKEDRAKRALEQKELLSEQKDLSGLETAIPTAVGQIGNLDNLSGKERNKAEATLAALAGKAKLTVQDIQEQYDEALKAPENQEPGKYYGTNPSPTKAAQAVSKNLLTGIKTRLKEIEQRKKELNQGSTASRTVSPEKNPPPGMVPMIRPDNGKTVNMPADKVKDAEARGYTRQ